MSHEKSHTEAECRKELADIRRLLYGDPATGRGGLAQVVEMMGMTLYGSKEIPGGVVSDLMAIKRTLWMVGGGVIVAQVGLQILFHFIK